MREAFFMAVFSWSPGKPPGVAFDEFVKRGHV
jgi:hypothetical protein